MWNRTTRAMRSYLRKVDRRLSNVAKDERQAILDDLRSHISEALVNRTGTSEPTPADVKAVLAEMDPPEAFGAVGASEVLPVLRQIAGKIALCLSVLGIMSPFLLYHNRNFGGDDQLPYRTYLNGLHMCLIAEMIALTLGIMASRGLYGKLAIVLSLGTIIVYTQFFRWM